MRHHPSPATERTVPAVRLARFELRRFRGPLPTIALLFVLIIPLLYGAIYLTANWDPYGRLDRLPVALVNEDRPAEVTDGDTTRTVAAGDDFVDSMLAKQTFDVRQVDRAEAERGLREGDYYLAVVVPATFSADLVSGQGDDPRRATIMLRRNDANGFVIGSITNSAQNSIARAVDESAVASYFDAVFANLAAIRSGLGDAADGAERIADGLTSARTGAQRLTDGATTARDGARSLASGLDRLDTGSARLADGAAQVAAGTQRLDDAVVPVLTTLEGDLPALQRRARAAGAALDSVAGTAAAGSGSVAADLTAAQDALDRLAADHPEVADDPAFVRLQGRVNRAGERADDIAATARDGAATADRLTAALGDRDLASRLGQARRDLVRLNSGAQQVASGAQTLHTGIGQAGDGADDLATGLATLRSGSAELTGGLERLRTGAESLRDRLAAGAKRIPALSADQRADAVQVLSSPADVTMQVDNPAGVYGRGLAPMFFSIAMWVFGISVFLVVRPITGRALAGRASPVRLALTGWLPVGAIAVAGAWLMVGVVWATLGLDPVHPWLFLGLVTLGAVCFSAIAHLLRTTLGTPGSSLLLIWLILQLTSAGGTYPSPILPGFFQAIGPFMPMTYLIDAFRVVISGGELAHLARDAGLLAAVAATALGLGVLVVRRRQQFRLEDLHPPLVAP